MAIIKPIFACVYKTGGDYGIPDVFALKEQVVRNTTLEHRFICLTDHPGLLNSKRILKDHYNIEAEELKDPWPGWWSVINLFTIIGPVVCTGLDTVIVGNIDKLFYLAMKAEDQFGLITSFNPRTKYRLANGIMIWNGDYQWIYEKFKKHPKRIMSMGMGEMDYSIEEIVQAKIKVFRIQEVMTGVYSYKHHCRDKGLPSDANIILFHGKPRPKDAIDEWVRKARGKWK